MDKDTALGRRSDRRAEKEAHTANLPVEGWFWELVRRDARFGRRFDAMERAAEEYSASRLGPEEYGRLLKSYLAHLRRYGLKAVPLSKEEAARLSTPRTCLLLPFPAKAGLLAVPRPDVAYTEFTEGLRPSPIYRDHASISTDRLRIRQMLRKYGLLEKGGTAEGPA